MILQKMPHYVDSILTQEDASAALQDGQVVVGLYTNRENVQSVVHSHPYYEMILPVAGSSVRYSVDGSVYDLHLGELILFPGEMYHSGKFNITDTTSERLVVQIAPGIWERAWAQSGLPRHVWSGNLSFWTLTPSRSGTSAVCWSGWPRPCISMKKYAIPCNAARSRS